MNKKDKETNSVNDLLRKLEGVCSASVLKTNSAQLDIECDELVDGKLRRRSAIMDDQAISDVDNDILGYEQRITRMQRQGQSIEDLDQEEQTEFNRLFAKGVYLLGMREHSIQELTDKLNARTESMDIVLAVIDELLANKYLSDERFAESYVRARSNRGFGPIKIQAELKTKGVNQSLITEFVDVSSTFWFDVARKQYEKKYSSNNVKDYKEWTKRARFLQSRGFNMEHIQAVQSSSGFY